MFFVVSYLVIMKAGFKPLKYFLSSSDAIVGGLLGDLLVFILVWVLSQNLVHILWSTVVNSNVIYAVRYFEQGFSSMSKAKCRYHWYLKLFFMKMGCNGWEYKMNAWQKS